MTPHPAVLALRLSLPGWVPSVDHARRLLVVERPGRRLCVRLVNDWPRAVGELVRLAGGESVRVVHV